jgi:predicted  nucleic acid-binding Zn-ribbon protein
VASDDLKRRIEREIQEHEGAIRKLEAERDGGTLARRLAEAKAELRAFQQGSRGRILELERQIAAIRSEDKIPRIEQEIENFHAQERIDEIERRVAPAMERLTELMRKLGS